MGALAQRVRAKFPGAYDDFDDAALETKVLGKFPQYADLAGPPLPAPVPIPAPPSRAPFEVGSLSARQVPHGPVPGQAPPMPTQIEMPAGPTGTLPAGPPVPGEQMFAALQPEEPETRGAVLRNLLRLPANIAAMPVTLPATLAAEGAGALPGMALAAVPFGPEVAAAVQAPPGERMEAAARAFGKTGGLGPALGLAGVAGVAPRVARAAGRAVDVTALVEEATARAQAAFADEAGGVSRMGFPPPTPAPKPPPLPPSLAVEGRPETTMYPPEWRGETAPLRLLAPQERAAGEWWREGMEFEPVPEPSGLALEPPPPPRVAPPSRQLPRPAIRLPAPEVAAERLPAAPTAREAIPPPPSAPQVVAPPAARGAAALPPTAPPVARAAPAPAGAAPPPPSLAAPAPAEAALRPVSEPVTAPAGARPLTQPVGAAAERGTVTVPTQREVASFARTMVLKGPLNAASDLYEQVIGAKTVDALGRLVPAAVRREVARRLHDKYVDAPQQGRAILYARDAAMSADYLNVSDLVDATSKVPKAERGALWRAINEGADVAPGSAEWNALGKHRKVVEALQEFNRDLGSQAVEYGLMSPESFAAYDGRYQHLVTASAQPFRRRGVAGVARIEPALRSEYGVFKRRTGEGTYIEDPVVSLTEGAPQHIHAARTAQALHEIGGDPGLYRPLGIGQLRVMRQMVNEAKRTGTATAEQVMAAEQRIAAAEAERTALLKAGWRELPESRRLRSTHMEAPKAFDLSGGLAHPGVFEDVQSIAATLDDAQIAKAAFLATWKMGMVANAVTLTYNLLGAARNADLIAGIPLSRQVTLLPMAVREMVQRGPLYREAVRAGALRGNILKADLDVMGEAIEAALAERHRGGGALAWYARYAVGAKRAMQRFPVARLYRANDDAFKLMIYTTERELGRTPRLAAALAQKAEHNYAQKGTWVEAASSRWWAIPFATYPAKQVPLELYAAAARPISHLKWWFIYDAFKHAVGQLRGETDAEQRARERVIEFRRPGAVATGVAEAGEGGEEGRPYYTDVQPAMGFAPRAGRFTFEEGPSLVPTGFEFGPQAPTALTQPAFGAREGVLPGPFAPLQTPAAVLPMMAATARDPRTGERVVPAGATAGEFAGRFGREAAASVAPAMFARQPIETARLMMGARERDVSGRRVSRAVQLWNIWAAPKAIPMSEADVRRGVRRGFEVQEREAVRPKGERRKMSAEQRAEERRAQRERKRRLRGEKREVLYGR